LTTLINVRFGPLCGLKSDIARGPKSATSGCEQSQERSPLFDHLVGKLLEMQRHVEAEYLGGLEVDDQLELGG